MAEEQEQPAQMLVRALNELKDEERDQVLAWLFSRIPNATIPTAAALGSDLRHGRMRRWREYAAVESSILSTFGVDPTRGDLQMVPIRMPVELHARLREWCKEHNFSMATVIRGLLARFLDEQGQPPPTEPA